MFSKTILALALSALLTAVSVLAQDSCGGNAPCATTTASGAQAAKTYRCPMCPEVTSTEKGAKCPKCGMWLEEEKSSKEKEGEAKPQEHAGHAH